MTKMTIICLLLAFLGGQYLLAACLWVSWEMFAYMIRRDNAFQLR